MAAVIRPGTSEVRHQGQGFARWTGMPFPCGKAPMLVQHLPKGVKGTGSRQRKGRMRVLSM